MSDTDRPIGASLRQNGKPLLISRVKLEKQRRQIHNAERRAYRRQLHGIPCNCINCTFDVTYQRQYTTGGKGLERQLAS